MVKVLTYNIHKGFDRYNRGFILRRIKEQLQKTDIDVVLLQEIQGRHLRHESNVIDWPMATQLEFLADSIWPHYAYGKNAIYRRGHHGNAILSKYSISEWSNLNLSRFRRASRSLLHGRIDIPEKDRSLHLLCVHLDLIGFERNRQVRELKRYIEDTIPEDEALIMGGDFNDWRSGMQHALEDQLGLHEAHRHLAGYYAKTFPSHRPMLRMDRIYFRGVDLVESHVLDRHPWDELSDHLPLFAEFAEA
jgi:endonuclease/exonuclease/phosphatase family metal-dependent hydrolase